MENRNHLGGCVKDAEAMEQKKSEFANLTYDSGFKIVFGTEGRSERLLMLMLNHVLGMKIVSVKYLPTERLGLTVEESKSFFDVYCKDSHGRRFLIEMQMWSQSYYHKRAVYYSSLSVLDQARVEKKMQREHERPWDYYFAPVYQISFLNYPNTIVETKEDEENQYVSHYVYKSKDTGRELGDETNIIFIDLAKLRKSFDELYTEAHLAAWPAEMRSLYEKYIMNRNDYENILYERYDKGYSDGHQQGLTSGLEEGREEALAMVIRRMIESGMTSETVVDVLQISPEEVERMLQ